MLAEWEPTRLRTRLRDYVIERIAYICPWCGANKSADGGHFADCVYVTPVPPRATNTPAKEECDA